MDAADTESYDSSSADEDATECADAEACTNADLDATLTNLRRQLTDDANGIPIEHQRLFLGILHTAVQLKRTAEQRERHIHQLEEQLEMKDEIIEIKDRILVSKESVIESQLTQLAKLRRYLRARGQH